jgi:mRNA-degrading endonuclease RelE of RelBE toxin-antitoxin system
MFTIEISDAAVGDLRVFKKNEQVLILDSVNHLLSHDPSTETRNRKRLRVNPLSQWELRIDQFRVFYDIDPGTKIILVKAVGWKDHNILRIRGKEYPL